MPEVCLTESLARRARDAARAASGAKPGHLAEAVAAGLGFGTHAALVAAIRGAPLAEAPRVWDGRAAAARLASLYPASGLRGPAAMAEAGRVLEGGQADTVERIAGFVRRVSEAGGGQVTFTERDDGRSEAWVSSEAAAVRVHGIAYPGIAVGDLARDLIVQATPAGIVQEGDGLVSGPLPPARLGLPRDNVPGHFYVSLQGGVPDMVTLTAPPVMARHAGLAEAGLDPEAIRTLRPYLDASPGIRIVSGVTGRIKRAVARVAAHESARGGEIVALGHWGDPPVAGSGDPADGDHHASENERLLAGLRAGGVSGRVVLFPTLSCHWEADLALRLAGDGACVWATIDAGSASEARNRLLKMEVDADACRLIWQCPNTLRGDLPRS